MSFYNEKFYQCVQCYHIQHILANCMICGSSLMNQIYCIDDAGCHEIEIINSNILNKLINAK